jgi:hypothetical protein
MRQAPRNPKQANFVDKSWKRNLEYGIIRRHEVRHGASRGEKSLKFRNFKAIAIGDRGGELIMVISPVDKDEIAHFAILTH